MLGAGRARDLLRYLRGPSGVSPRQVDWFERRLRRDRVQTRDRGALALGRAIRGAAGGRRPDPGAGAAGRRRPGSREVASLRDDDGRTASARRRLELRAAGAIATRWPSWPSSTAWRRFPNRIARALSAISVRVWSGPVEDRVQDRRSPPGPSGPLRPRLRRLAAGRRVPARRRHRDPFLSERQRDSLGLQPRHDNEAEERYLFHACLALPRRRLFLSYRDSDENGARRGALAAARRRQADARRPGGEEIRGRALADVVYRIADAPSEDELARAIAACGTGRRSGPAARGRRSRQAPPPRE